jgi:hypothetical protein
MSTNSETIRRKNKKIGKDLNNEKHGLDGKANPNSGKEQMKVKNNMRSNLQIGVNSGARKRQQRQAINAKHVLIVK